MKEEGRENPSMCISQEGHNKNLCIFGDGAKQSEDNSWSITIFEREIAREMQA